MAVAMCGSPRRNISITNSNLTMNLGRSTSSILPAALYRPQQTGGGLWGEAPGLHGLAIDNSTGYLYADTGSPHGLNVFDDAGDYKETWPLPCSRKPLAADNSGGEAEGRVYLSTECGFSVGVRAFQGQHEPAEFSDTAATYVHGNTITGTPTYPLSMPGPITVDSKGNIYVVEEQKSVVDEFKSTGEFIREFTGAGAPGGFGRLRGVAVDPTNGDLLVVNEGNDMVDEPLDSLGNYLGRIKDLSVGLPGQGFPRVLR